METKTLSRSLFSLCALLFRSSFPVFAKQQGNKYSLRLPVVPEAGGKKGTQWRHCGVSVPPTGTGFRAVSGGPDDGAPWWSAGRDTMCNVGVWAEHAALQLQSEWSLFEAQGRTNKQPRRHSPLRALCVFYTAKTHALTKVLKIHFQGALTGADGRPHRNLQRANENCHWN